MIRLEPVVRLRLHCALIVHTVLSVLIRRFTVAARGRKANIFLHLAQTDYYLIGAIFLYFFGGT